MVTLALLITAFFGTPLHQQVTLTLADVWAGAGLAGLMLGLVAPSLLLVPKASRALMDYQIDRLQRAGIRLSWQFILFASIVAGISEEALFRGALQGSLVEHVPLWMTLLVSNLAFGVLHGPKPILILATFTIGLVLGLAFHLGASLVALMFAHALYDMVALALLMHRAERRAKTTPAA